MAEKDTKKRAEWKVGSAIQIFSKSENKWCNGKIRRIIVDRQGEWLQVEYQGTKGMRIKEMGRYEKEALRPLSPHRKYHSHRGHHSHRKHHTHPAHHSHCNDDQSGYYGDEYNNRAYNPHPYGSNIPRLYGSNNSRPYGSNNPRPYGSNNPRPYGSNNPRPYGPYGYNSRPSQKPALPDKKMDWYILAGIQYKPMLFRIISNGISKNGYINICDVAEAFKISSKYEQYYKNTITSPSLLRQHIRKAIFAFHSKGYINVTGERIICGGKYKKIQSLCYIL